MACDFGMKTLRALLLLLIGCRLQAQDYPVGTDRSLYPGSRFSIYIFSFDRVIEPSHLIATIAGRDYILPRITERFPPAEEVNPDPQQAIHYLVPTDIPLGIATLRIAGLTSFITEIEVGGPPSYTAVYTLPFGYLAYAQQQTGSGPIRRNRHTDPARPGDRVTLWATGLSIAVISILDARINAKVVHQSDGLDRVEFTLPDSTPAACYLNLWVNGQFIMLSTGSADSAAACPHPLGVTAADLLRLDRGLKISLSSWNFGPTGVSVRHGSYRAAHLSVISEGFGVITPSPPVYGCRSGQNSRGFGRSFSGPGPGNIGANAELIAPDGSKFDARPSFDHWFFDAKGEPAQGESQFWSAGEWTFRILSNSQFRIPADELKIVAPQPFRWKTAPILTPFFRTRDFVVEWDTARVSAGDTVSFLLNVFTPFATELVDDEIGSYVFCIQPASAGKLTVPATLMQSIPAAEQKVFVPHIDVHLQPRYSLAPGNRYVSLQFGFSIYPDFPFIAPAQHQ